MSILRVDARGTRRSRRAARALRPETVLVSIGAACAEIGTLQPLGEHRADHARGGRAAPRGCASAPWGACRSPAKSLGLDLVTVSSNDLYGPPGSGGALGQAAASSSRRRCWAAGRRVATDPARRTCPALGRARRRSRADAGRGGPRRARAPRRAPRSASWTRWPLSIPDCRADRARATDRLPHHASLVLRGVKADSVLLDLDLCGVAASSGSACAQRTGTPSHVLRAIGCTPEEMEGSLCFTLGRWSTLAEVDAVLDRLAAHRRAPARARACPPPLIPMRLVLFDIDGTILTARGAGRRALAARAHGGVRDGGRHRAATTFAAGRIRASSRRRWRRAGLARPTACVSGSTTASRLYCARARGGSRRRQRGRHAAGHRRPRRGASTAPPEALRRAPDGEHRGGSADQARADGAPALFPPGRLRLRPSRPADSCRRSPRGAPRR